VDDLPAHRIQCRDFHANQRNLRRDPAQSGWSMD
jgi:hypothetical protein